MPPTKSSALALCFCCLGSGLVACGARAELLPIEQGGDAGTTAPTPTPTVDASDDGADTQPAPVSDSGAVSDDATAPIDSSIAISPSNDAGATCIFDYDGAAPTVVPGINGTGVQNIPAGTTPTASSILIQQGNFAGSLCSDGLSVLVADELPPGSGTYQTALLTLPPGMDSQFEENITLTADGLTIIGLNQDDTGFLQTTRSAIGAADFVAATVGPFGQITASGDGQTLWAPAISADGLAFYYTVHDDPDGTVNGIYESIRRATNAPFPAGTRMPELMQDVAQYVTGLTVDRLTIFVEQTDVFAVIALTRASLADDFSYPSPMPVLPGLRVKPIDGCAQLLGTCGSGCNQEKICTWPAP